MKFFSTIVISALSLSAFAVPVGRHRGHAAGQQQQAATPAPAAAAPATGNVAATTGGVDPALVPPFGIVAGTDPDGHGNCVGANGVLIPCSCPPPEDQFLQVSSVLLPPYSFLGFLLPTPTLRPSPSFPPFCLSTAC